MGRLDRLDLLEYNFILFVVAIDLVPEREALMPNAFLIALAFSIFNGVSQ